eukprot:1015478-Pelagomonas_calceolata.AAC.2
MQKHSASSILQPHHDTSPPNPEQWRLLMAWYFSPDSCSSKQSCSKPLQSSASAQKEKKNYVGRGNFPYIN